MTVFYCPFCKKQTKAILPEKNGNLICEECCSWFEKKLPRYIPTRTITKSEFEFDMCPVAFESLKDVSLFMKEIYFGDIYMAKWNEKGRLNRRKVEK